MKSENNKIKEEISKILTGKEDYNQDDLLKTEQEFVNAEKDLSSLEINSEKKYHLLNEWHSIVQMMCQR